MRRMTPPTTIQSPGFSRVSLTLSHSRIETDLLDQPIVRIEECLLSQVVSRVIPANRLGLRRGAVQQLRVGRRYELVRLSVLQEQRSRRSKPDESDRLDRYHFAKPGD